MEEEGYGDLSYVSRSCVSFVSLPYSPFGANFYRRGSVAGLPRIYYFKESVHSSDVVCELCRFSLLKDQLTFRPQF
jgi:hypothetical protein